MDAQLRETSLALRDKLRSARANIDLFTNSPVIEKYMVTEDEEERYLLLQRPLLRLFKRYQEAYPDYYELRVLLEDGYEDTRLTVQNLPNKNEEEGDTRYFAELSSHEQDIYTTFFRNEDNGELALIISKRIRLRDPTSDPILTPPTTRGYFSITSNLLFIKQKLENERVGKTGFMIMVDAPSNVVLQPNDAVIDPESAHDLIRRFEALPVHVNLLTTQLNNQRFIFKALPVDDGIHLAALFPESDLVSGSRQLGVLIAAITVATIFITTILLFFSLKKLLINPIQRLNVVTHLIGEGKLDAPIHVHSRDEIGELAASFRDMAKNLSETHAHVQHLAYHDSVTNLPNRRMFRERLEKSLANASRNNERIAVLFLDLDNFKNVNDTLGHEAGDTLIKDVSARLETCIRESDYIARDGSPAKEDLIARLGGDEFILLLNQLDEAIDASSAANRILERITEPFSIQGVQLHVGASIGITLYPEDGRNADKLIKNADIAMYHAKRKGKNNYQYFSESLNIAVERRLNIENRLRDAINKNEFILLYQPIIDVKSGKITSAEALIRWQDPEEGMIPPDEFIPVAEESGLIVPLGKWVLDEACRQLRAWQNSGYDELTVAVNISSVQVGKPGLVETVSHALRVANLKPHCLNVELTETSLLEADEETTKLTIGGLKALGVTLSLDDFGTGYSSLSHLQRFPFNALKIDRSFVRDIITDPNDAAICSATIAMAHNLGLKVTAEGVEELTHVNFLVGRHCDRLQGYYFSRPLPARDFEALLAQNGAAQPLFPTTVKSVKTS